MEKHYMDSSAPPSYEEVQAGLIQPGFRQPPPSMPMPMPMAPSFQHQQQTMQPHHNQYQYPAQPQVPYPVHAVPAPVQQQPAVTTTTVIVNSAPPNVGPRSQHLVCPNCGKSIRSKIITENNLTTHMVAVILCIMGCFLCSCIPYCMDSCKNLNHYCPSCNAYLGTYGPMSLGGRQYR